MSNGGKARINLFGVDERAEEPRAEEASAHTGHGDVERGDERGGTCGARGVISENGIDEFEIANGNGIEDERVLLLVVTDAIEMAECLDTGGVVTTSSVFAKIVDDGSGGGKSFRMAVQAKSGEFGNAELFAEDSYGVVALEDPVFEAGFNPACAIEERSFRGFEELVRAGKESFAGTKKLEFVAERFFRGGAAKFSGLEFSGGEIDEREADGVAAGIFRYGGEKVVFARVKDGDIGGRAGSDDADDFAADEFFAGTGLLHLIANSDFESGADEAGDVCVRSVVGDPAHRDRLALFAIARSESDVQFAGGDHGVFVEQLVEIAEAEEQEGVRIARLDGVILLHERCGGVAHEK